MATTYIIPSSIKIKFDPKEFPEINNRIYRILWVSISIGHLRDQYFKGYISKAVRAIKRNDPNTFKDFLKVIETTDLYKFGKGYYGKKKNHRHSTLWCSFEVTPLNKRWWLQVWNLISQNGDIELIQDVIK